MALFNFSQPKRNEPDTSLLGEKTLAYGRTPEEVRRKTGRPVVSQPTPAPTAQPSKFMKSLATVQKRVAEPLVKTFVETPARLVAGEAQKQMLAAKVVGQSLGVPTTYTPTEKSLLYKYSGVNPETGKKDFLTGLGRGVESTAQAVGTVYNIAKAPANILLGGVISGGAQAVGNIREGKPFFEGISEAAQRGVELSYVLPLTQALTNAFASKFIPSLTTKAMGETAKAAYEVAKQTPQFAARMKIYGKLIGPAVQRALLETPTEALAYGTVESIKQQKKWIDSVANNVVSSLIGNVTFAVGGVGIGAGKTEIGIEGKRLKEFIKSELSNQVDLLRTTMASQRGSVQIPGGEGIAKTLEEATQKAKKIGYGNLTPEEKQLIRGGKGAGAVTEAGSLHVSDPALLKKYGESLGPKYGALLDETEGIFNQKVPYTKETFDRIQQIQGLLPKDLKPQTTSVEKFIAEKLGIPQDQLSDFTKAETAVSRVSVKKGGLPVEATQNIQELGSVTGEDLAAIDKNTQEFLTKHPELQQATPVSTVENAGQPPVPGDKYAFNINKTRMGLDDAGRKNLDEAVVSVQKELETNYGTPLTKKEVIEAAKQSDLLERGISSEQTKKLAAATLRLRQEVAGQAGEEGLTPEFVKNIKTLSSIARDAGQKLKAFDISAEPELYTPKAKLVDQMIKLGIDADALAKAGENVNWDDQRQVTEFYRQFVKPKASEILQEYRYANLLSSPDTHKRNLFTNLIQATITDPATKLTSGVTDYVAAKLTGKERTHYVSEVPVYYRGLINSVGEAVSNFNKALSGELAIKRPDVTQQPTGVKLLQPLRVIPKLLEAADVFSRTLIKGGEMEALSLRYKNAGKEIDPTLIEEEASNLAERYIFRNALDPENKTGQGELLSWIDKGTSVLYKARKIPGVGWFIPFIQTPMNIAKQSIEYSPAGILTAVGAKDPTEQFGKAMLGSGVMLGSAWLINQTDSTWSAPTGEKAQQKFYASGRKPYSIRIGDHWYQYNQLGPLAFPIALAAAMKYYGSQSPTALTDTGMKKAEKILGGMLTYFSDQTYLRGIDNLINVVQGRTYSIEQALGDIPRQLIPLSSLVGWTSRLIDPIYRQAKSPLERVFTGIPFLSTTLEPYTTPSGEPSRRTEQLFNVFLPVPRSQVNPQGEAGYRQYQRQSQQRAKKAMTKEEYLKSLKGVK
jgi:hypothetical protein